MTGQITYLVINCSSISIHITHLSTIRFSDPPIPSAIHTHSPVGEAVYVPLQDGDAASVPSTDTVGEAFHVPTHDGEAESAPSTGTVGKAFHVPTHDGESTLASSLDITSAEDTFKDAPSLSHMTEEFLNNLYLTNIAYPGRTVCLPKQR